MDTGVNSDKVVKILEKFTKDGKIFYADGWVGIKNFIKHQTVNPKVLKGIEIGLNTAPKQILDSLSIDYLSLSHSNLNSNLNSNSNPNSKYNPLGADVIKKFESIDAKNKNFYGNKTQRSACDFLLKEYGIEKVLMVIEVIRAKRGTEFFPSVTSPYELQNKWTKVGEALRRESMKNGGDKNIPNI
ncbi:MAG: hypothetical protein WC499_02650 [Patescibacteria group bacterium]